MANDDSSSDQLLPKSPDDFFVVGIGASAGGIAALRQFFKEVTRECGMAFVVIVHLSPQHESNLPSLLQSQTVIPVTQVTGTVKLEPNHVYVIPPSKYLAIINGTIRLAEPERTRGAHTSIDLLFRTLAEAYGTRAVGVILSGTGTDGSAGIGRIKEQGGFVIVQDPAEAEYSDMPRCAIETARIDLVLHVSEIPGKLASLRDGMQRVRIIDRGEIQPTESDASALREVLTLLRWRTGNDFSQYKRATLLRRIARRLQVNEIPDIAQYLGFLRERPDELPALMRDLLINVTNFFRDPDAFDFLKQQIIPAIFAGKGPDDQIRVWCPGCATGEEAYSLAMLLAEHAAQVTDPPKLQIFATDIDPEAIAHAREGVYPATISLDVSPERLRQFFTKDGDRYRISKDLREIVLFAPHNVLGDPPFSRLDLISCRNLLIYLNREIQERALAVFHFALRHDGYLFLGASESAEVAPALFHPVESARRVYKRCTLLSAPQPAPELITNQWQVRPPETPPVGRSHSISAGELHERAVEQVAPPSVLIDENYDIVHVSENAGRYLRIGGGEPTRNILKLAHPDLQLDLRAALLRARSRERNEAPESRTLRAEIDGVTRSISLSVRPITRKLAREFFLVIFDDAVNVTSFASDQAQQAHAGLDVVRQLEQELQQTKEHLRVTIEQYETSTEELKASNEELQAINEELRSATEEAQTSKEELHSLNEELTTVNHEYREKIEEVARANSDLQNLMASTDIATIFLDRALRIKRYTPRAQRLFNITPTDAGRPLEHFTHKLEYAVLTEDAEEVLRNLRTFEREIHGTDGSWYLARLVPYRTQEDKIDGVVLTFVDITNRKEAEERLRHQANQLRQQTEILNLAHVLIRDSADRIITWNIGCERLYGYTREQALGRISHELLHTEFPRPIEEINEELYRAGQWEGELVHTNSSGKRIIVASHWVLHRPEPNATPVVLEVNNDVTAMRLAEEALRETDRNKDRFLAMLAHELRNPLGAMFNVVELMKRASPANAGPAQREVETLQRQLQNLSRMVDDLLDFERLSHGKIALYKDTVSVSEVIDAAVETCRPLIDAKAHRFELSLPAQPAFLYGDPMRLSQVVANILHNALKYTPDGGQVELKAELTGSEVAIRVRDTGIGISGELLPRLFDIYSQDDPLSQAQHKGLGVGLALVRQLVELHGGSVDATSPGLGRGSEFIVRLPAASAPKQGIEDGLRRDQPQSGAAKNIRVLIVDDFRDAADALADILTSEGYQTRVAYDGEAALTTVSEFRPDIAILDIGLPGMNGYEVASRCREIVPEVVLIALSGWGAGQEKQRAEQAGFDRYVTKPIEPKRLIEILAEL